MWVILTEVAIQTNLVCGIPTKWRLKIWSPIFGTQQVGIKAHKQYSGKNLHEKVRKWDRSRKSHTHNNTTRKLLH